MAVGWMIWRDKQKIPQDLLLESSYLRGSHTNFSLSFSRSGAPVAGQYYKFHCLGMDGYRESVQRARERAQWMSTRLHDTGYFSCLGDKRPRFSSPELIESSSLCQEKDCTMGAKIPIVVFTFSDRIRESYPGLRLLTVSDAMHDMKSSIPSKATCPITQIHSNILSGYTLGGWGAEGQDIDVMRVVLRDEMTDVVLEEILTSLRKVVEHLIKHI